MFSKLTTMVTTAALGLLLVAASSAIGRSSTPVLGAKQAFANCRGRRAYTKMAFYSKSRPSSRWKLGSKWDICSGAAE